MKREANIAVIGGGYAGLAAAVTLAQRKIPVTVFEAARQLGGRARGVEYRGVALDNGLHILLGSYRETLRLIDAVCAPGDSSASCFLRLPLQFVIHGHFKLKAAPLPAPLHLAAGLLSAKGAPFNERIAAARFMLKMRRNDFSLSQDVSVSALLRQHAQGDNIGDFLWKPLCVSALNTPPETASARVFLNVLRDGLNGRRSDSDLLLPKVDLSALFPDRAARYIRNHGGKIQTSKTVTAIDPDTDGFRVAAGDERFKFSHVICALPSYRACAFLVGMTELSEIAEMIQGFEYEPIYSVYFQFPVETRLPLPMVGLHGGYAQWLFDRGQLCGQKGMIAAVISASGAHQQLTQDELAACVHEELQRNFGPLPQPAWHRVIAEKRATFSCTVNLRRPPQLTPLRNFYLAGDYTASDYPATIEAAVQSGVKCANFILQKG